MSAALHKSLCFLQAPFAGCEQSGKQLPSPRWELRGVIGVSRHSFLAKEAADLPPPRSQSRAVIPGVVPGHPRRSRDAELPILHPALFLPPFPGGALREQGRICSWKRDLLRAHAAQKSGLFGFSALPMPTLRTAGTWTRCFHWPVRGWHPRGVFLSGKSLSLCLGFGTTSLRAEARFSLPNLCKILVLLLWWCRVQESSCTASVLLLGVGAA